MRLKAVTVGIVLAVTALGSGALTLGRARGAAWIGQALELTVPVQVDPGQTEGALCAEADVFHGDSRQESNRVQVSVLPTDQPDAFNLKISSSALIDEPVVTVYLRAGCSQKSSRKYVLLADFPNESAAPLSRAVTPTAAALPLVTAADANSTATAPAAGATSNTAAAAAANAKNSKPSLPTPKEAAKELAKPTVKTAVAEAPKASAPKKDSPAKVEKPVEAAKPAAAGKPRLRLDPIETLNERVKSLESTTTATTVQADQARDGQKMELLQSDLKTLLEQAVKNEASLMAMRERLEKAESDRVPVALVYALAALVLLCLGALAFVWSRRNGHPAWETSSGHGQDTAARQAAAPARPTAAQASKQQDVDVDLMDLDADSFDQLMGHPAPKKH